MSHKKTSKKKLLLEMFGWYGSLAIIGAYFLSSFEVLAPTDLSYQLLNFTGGLGIMAISWYKKVWQSVALNIVWGVIAVSAIVKILL